ncbi:hypothetical protein PVAP13_6NG350000 [Panicum virgatum]|uniref:Uncharacterized protein n=2 Tax=Panicum virgatum TaxID=38727 RepID=A0A8T0R2D5_PANVG|nr:hypothetical protein PVAP13_6NG350000 [Panicum virgatum]
MWFCVGLGTRGWRRSRGPAAYPVGRHGSFALADDESRREQKENVEASVLGGILQCSPVPALFYFGLVGLQVIRPIPSTHHAEATETQDPKQKTSAAVQIRRSPARRHRPCSRAALQPAPGPLRAGSRVAWGGVMEAPAAMDAEDDDARGFKAVFTAAGEELLQGRMREKLREFRRSESDPEGLLLDLEGTRDKSQSWILDMAGRLDGESGKM